MKIAITTLGVILFAASTLSYANAEEVPSWVKSNAGWWADGTISESDFLMGIEYMVTDGILVVPPTAVSQEQSDSVPSWVKSNAGWWADGTISDSDFINGIQHLMVIGILSVPLSEQSSSMSASTENSDSKLTQLESDLNACAEITKAYDRLNCERTAKHNITAYTIKNDSQAFQVGPVTYYWPGLETDGNTFEITSSGQALLNLRMLVENTGSDKKESLFCTGPAICNYDMTDGQNDYKYAQMDFTNGQLVLKPGESKMFNMMFGPNIGGGGTTFEYDSSKEYHFRINESFGSMSIPLNLG